MDDEEQAYREMNRTDRELERAHEKTIRLARQFHGDMSTRSERAWNEDAFKEMRELEADEKRKREAFDKATRRWIELFRALPLQDRPEV